MATTEALHVVNATAKTYLKGASDLTIRNRLLLALIQKQGNIEYNATGFDNTWNLEYAQPVVRQYGDQEDLEFSEHDAYKQATLDWRGYSATDRLTKKQNLMNKGSSQIVDLYGTKTKLLTKSLRQKFNGELYIDGNAANNGNRIHGLESFLANSTTVAADLIAKPGDTYAGLSTAVAAFGGTWTSARSISPNASIATDWPYGTGDSEYDFFSPKLVNWSSTSLPSGETTWLLNCSSVLRYTLTWCLHITGEENIPYCFFLNTEMFAQFKEYMEAKQRILVEHKSAQDLGFANVLSFEGAMVKQEYDCPVNTGYGISPEHMELSSLQGQLFVPEGPRWDMKSKSYLYALDFFGNCRFQPKYFAKLKNFA